MARRPAPRPQALLVLLVALVAGLPTLVWLRGAFDESEPLPVPVTDAPDAYRVVYEVEDLAGGGSSVSTEVVTVRRPFEGRVEVRRGSPPGGETLSVTVGAFARRQLASGDQEPIVLTVEPGPPEGDSRWDATLREAENRGMVRRLDEQRTIAGRACDVYRLPVLSPSGRDEGDRRELCLDGAGLVLADELVVEGNVQRRGTAVEVELDPDLGDDVFAVDGAPVPVEAGGGALRRLTDDSRVADATVHELPAAPAGFDHLGRFALTPAGAVDEPGVPWAVRVVGVIDVWRRGPDFVAVFNGGADDGRDPFADDATARPVEVPGIEGAETVVGPAGGEVRADLGEGRFIRVFGTLPLDRLVSLARNLEPRRGGEITPLG